ncbi:MAG: hypothetical protein PVG39_00020 [Desulfobacteraceae bacterium]|jgi:hypothetical protein
MKTATKMLERYSNPRDEYEENINRAAKHLVDTNRGHYCYSTQWVSGNSQWYSPKEEKVITVNLSKLQ